MPRWIKNGGWVLVLAVLIFLSFCAFYLMHTQAQAGTQPEPPIIRYKSPSPQIGRGYAGSISVVSLSITSGTDVDNAFSPPEPSIYIEQPSTPDDAAVSDSESENDENTPDNNTEIETQEQTLETEDDNGGIAAINGEDIPVDDITVTDGENEQTENETITALLQIRDALYIQITLTTLVIAAAIVYLFILRPLYNFTR